MIQSRTKNLEGKKKAESSLGNRAYRAEQAKMHISELKETKGWKKRMRINAE